MLQKRIKSKQPPKNMTELVTISETLNHQGTLEVGSFVTVDFNETLEPRGSESPMNGMPTHVFVAGKATFKSPCRSIFITGVHKKSVLRQFSALLRLPTMDIFL